MPGILYQPLPRRSFLKAASLGGIALVLGGCQTSSQRSASSADKFHLVLLSDTHIAADPKNEYRGFNPTENLKRIVPEVIAAKPEAVILNGDAARLEGLPGDYVQLKGLLHPIAETCPIYLTLGNHDDRPNFSAAIQPPPGIKQPLKERVVLVIDNSFMRIIMLDSLLFPNKTPGLLGKEQRTWLATYLQEHKDKPTVLFVHHTLKDNDGDLMDAERLFEIALRQRHVKAIFYGHSHVWELANREHLHLINLPAVGYNFRDQDPVGWMDAIFDPKGVDLTMRAFGGNRQDDGRKFRVSWS
jgi:Icc protein